MLTPALFTDTEGASQQSLPLDADATKCPDCHGIGYWYPGGEGGRQVQTLEALGLRAINIRRRGRRNVGDELRLPDSPQAFRSLLR
jgi:hypothetical protein